jgi:HK97 family phage portal protein
MAGIRDVISLLRGNQPDYQAIIWGNDLKSTVLGMPIDELWRTQPYLRTVVTFLARNVAQLGVHVFERVSDTDRRRLRDDSAARLLSRPNADTTTYELIFGLVADLALYDEAFWLLAPDVDAPSGWTLTALSPAWITARGGGSVFTPGWVEFTPPGKVRPTRIDLPDLVWFHGWNPGSPTSSSSPVEALKQILAEQVHAMTFREQMWRRGGRIGGYLTRPIGAKWDAGVRERFMQAWKTNYAGDDAPKAGGTPILEDGMEYKRPGFSAHEDEYIQGSKLALATVAAVYQVNPTMVGLLDNANFSNVREFRKMLYGDTLGSIISMIEDRINAFLIPKVTNTEHVYAEFNIAEKLQGSFEEQAAVLSSSVGRPWMTADEARSRSNMPALGGDAAQLVVPLNVLIGGQASPRDSAPKARPAIATKSGRAERARVTLKSDDLDTSTYVEKAAEVLSAFFARQRRSVLSALGAKAADDYWDGARWDRELSDDLYALAMTTATALGQEQAKRLGFTEGDYDEDRTRAFLRAVADSRAGAINSTTKERLDDAIDDDDADPADVFTEAESARTGSAATALVAGLAGFALVEAAQQTTGSAAQKTWATGDNPRPDHAAMDGETVGIDEQFSNGADWPGDPVLGADGVSGCNCGVSISY